MLAWERQENESSRAYEAFSLYRDFGPSRSIAKVGQMLGKSKALLERWAVAHAWVARVKALEARDEMIRREALEAHAQEKAKDHAQREMALREKVLELREKAADQAAKMLEWPLTEQRVLDETEDGEVTYVFAPARWSKATVPGYYQMAVGDSSQLSEDDEMADLDLSDWTDEDIKRYLELMAKGAKGSCCVTKSPVRISLVQKGSSCALSSSFSLV